MYTRFLKRWVYLDTNMEDVPYKARILSVSEEAGEPCYVIELPDGRREIVFLTAVNGIQYERRKNAKILKPAFKQKLRLIK